MKFSLSMCVYGGDDPVWFDRALESVFSQSLQADEVVLCVDGPIGRELEDVIERYAREELKVIRLEKNMGHGEARRASVSSCSYPIVMIMDADDIACRDRFKLQIEAFESDPEIDVLGGQIEEFIGEENNIIGKRTVPEKDSDIKLYMKKRCPFNQQTVAFKRDIYERAGGYLDWYMEEDYYLWVRTFLNGAKFANLPQTLTLARMSADSYKRRGGWKYYRSERDFQKYLRKNGIISAFDYLRNISKRFIIQVLMPSSLRGYLFKKFARERS